jgi:hypothetical protein
VEIYLHISYSCLWHRTPWVTVRDVRSVSKLGREGNRKGEMVKVVDV